MALALLNQGHALHRSEVRGVKLIEIDTAGNLATRAIQTIPYDLLVTCPHDVAISERGYDLARGIVNRQGYRGFLNQVESDDRLRIEGIRIGFGELLRISS